MPRPLPRSVQAPNGFLFEDSLDRPFRTISIETEIDGSQQRVPEILFRAGMVANVQVMNYSHNPGLNNPHIAFCKSDATVTCGEIVFDRLNLTQERDAEALSDSLVWLRQLEREGHMSYSPSCGGHIHVDAFGFGFYDVARLYDLFGYLEEPIFRLAGAGFTYGHRSLFAARTGRNGYATAIVKDMKGHPREVHTKLRGQGRTVALNLTRYFGYNNCNGSCEMEEIDPLQDAALGEYGSQYGPDYAWLDDMYRADRETARRAYDTWLQAYRDDYGESAPQDIRERRQRELQRYYGSNMQRRPIRDNKRCTCPTTGRTIEWRVWNSSGHPRILYAWIALMQAMHSYCWRDADSPRYREVDDHEPMEWLTRTYDNDKMGRRDYVHKAQERVEFMFRELPLLPQEKDALAYAFMRTPYAEWGQEYFARLAKLPYVKPPEGNQKYESGAGYRAPEWRPIVKADGELPTVYEADQTCIQYQDRALYQYRDYQDATSGYNRNDEFFLDEAPDYDDEPF